MTVTRRRIVFRTIQRGSETAHDVTYEDVRFRIVFRPVDPVVHVQGVALEREAIIVHEGRRFHGYGPDEATAFQSALESAKREAALTEVDPASIVSALASSPPSRPPS